VSEARSGKHFVVQLNLDAEADATLKALATRLDTVPGLATVQGVGSAHHLSLAIYDDPPTEDVPARLADFADTLGPFTLNLANIGIFAGERSVLYLGPAVTEPLLALHRRFHALFRDLPCWPVYRPGAWIPHATLAMDIEPRALGPAVEIIRQAHLPITARLDSLALVEAFPVQTLVRIAL
jgi:2'-5' RNA ligase